MSESQKHKSSETSAKKQTPRQASRARQGPVARLEKPDLLAQQRAVDNPALAAPASISALQRAVGNQAVQRLLAPRQGGKNGFDPDDATASRINQARGRPVVRRRDRALVPAPAGQTFSASARVGGTGVLQRALRYQNKDFVPAGSIVACENPSPHGRRMVGSAAGAYGRPKKESKLELLRHAAIVAKTPGYVYESMGGGIERNAGKYMQGSPVYVMDAPPGGREEVWRAAREAAAAGRDLRRRRWWTFGARGERYSLRLAKLAVKKGRLERERDAARKAERASDGAVGRWLWRRRGRRLDERIRALSASFTYPALIDTGTRVRPTGHSYCVLFVIQCVQAALRNRGSLKAASAWIERLGAAPHVRDLVNVFPKMWQWAEWTDRGAGRQ